MRKRYFLKLVRKHLTGRSTAQEEQLLISYYNLFESEPDVLALLNEKEKEEIKLQMKTHIWQSISNQSEANEKIRHLKAIFIKAAAAVLIGGILACSYFLFRPHANTQIVNQQIIPRNENHLIHLPDGSTVIVMKDSKLTYASSFNKVNKREVYLEGEAYFDVKHDAAKPFIVHTGALQTTDLGTAFNIRAIKGDHKITVTVARGEVSVSNKYKVFGLIIPNQQMVFNTDKAVSVIKKVDADVSLTWKNQDILFDDVTTEEAARLLADRFKVNITFTDDKPKYNRFTTTFPHDESLQYILKIICELNNANYTYDEEKAKVIINSKTH
jgi:transmembrane sensor